MADIKSILEDLAVLPPGDIQEIAMILKDEYGIEASERHNHQEGAVTVEVKKNCPTSPKQYGISLLNRKRKKR